MIYSSSYTFIFQFISNVIHCFYFVMELHELLTWLRSTYAFVEKSTLHSKPIRSDGMQFDSKEKHNASAPCTTVKRNFSSSFDQLETDWEIKFLFFINICACVATVLKLWIFRWASPSSIKSLMAGFDVSEYPAYKMFKIAISIERLW